jgi:hypothetical protein
VGRSGASSPEACSFVSADQVAATLGLASARPAPVTPDLTTLANGATALTCQVALNGGDTTLLIVALRYPKAQVAKAEFESSTQSHRADTPIALDHVASEQFGGWSYRAAVHNAEALYLQGTRELYVDATVRDGLGARLNLAAFIALASTAARHWR